MFSVLTASFSPLYARDAAILAVQLFGARRASEVLELRCEDVKFDGKDFNITVRKSKTDQRGFGLLFTLPHNITLGINPTKVLNPYLVTHNNLIKKGKNYVFRGYNPFSRLFTEEHLMVAGWNAKLELILQHLQSPIRTSHALRAAAIYDGSCAHNGPSW